MSVVSIYKETADGFNAGNGTVGNTSQAIGTAWPVTKHVVVRANTGNSGTIKVGPTSGTATNGFILAAGETAPPIYVDDVSKIFVIGSAASQNYSWVSN